MTTFDPSTPARAGIIVDDSACAVDDLAFCGGVQVTVPADRSWGSLVELAVASDWVGVEALADREGTVADAVRANATAYGQCVGDTLSSVRTWDRKADTQKTFPAADCRLGDLTSPLAERLGADGFRYEILDVSFLFRQGDLTTPVRDGDLARLLAVESGARVPLGAVTEAIKGSSEDG